MAERREASRPSRGARRDRGDHLGGEQVEGRQAVRELLGAARRQIFEVLLADNLDPSPILAEITELSRQSSVPLRVVPARTLHSLAQIEHHQGVVARAAPIVARPLDELLDRAARPRFFVVFDRLTDPQNLGTLLRSSLGAGASGVLLPRHESARLSPAVVKAAAGAVEYLDFCLVPGVAGALELLARAGVWTVGLDAHAPRPFEELEVLTEDVALVFGAEGSGLSPLVAKRCDVLGAIPLEGPLDSLNVAAAGAVALFGVARQRRALGLSRLQSAGPVQAPPLPLRIAPPRRD